jgi:hypothetical protein
MGTSPKPLALVLAILLLQAPPASAGRDEAAAAYSRRDYPLEKRLQLYIHPLLWALVWPVPTWNLLTRCQSVLTAGKQPEELSE